MLNNTSKKFLFGFLGIMFVALLVWVGGTYLNPEVREKRALIKYFNDLETAYQNDTYGGATPEETLQLFISALEAGDIELASKYFLPDEREEKLKFLNDVKNAQNLKLLSAELSENFTKKDFTGDGSSFIFYFFNSENETELQVSFSSIPSGVWKIIDL